MYHCPKPHGIARLFSDNGFGQSNRLKSLRYRQRESQWTGPLGVWFGKVTGSKKSLQRII